MRPIYKDGNVKGQCPDCGGSVTTFEYQTGGREFGSIISNVPHALERQHYSRTIYQLMRCAGCGRGGIAKIHCNNSVHEGALEAFYPMAIEHAKIPSGVPEGILKEYREAELCASFGAWRAASALLRSTLEKTLKANGYSKGTLEGKIDEAAKDGIITGGRRKKAHDDIRVLGNDMLHEAWREITEDEVITSHHYTQRILEDFYDDRTSVENILKEKSKL